MITQSGSETVGDVGVADLLAVFISERERHVQRERIRERASQGERHMILYEGSIRPKPFVQRSLLHSMFFASNIEEFM